MANRRMVSKDVVRSRKYLEMSKAARLLYRDLVVDSDDDGFLDPYNTMLVTKADEEDLKTLIEKGFLLMFGSGIVAIVHWLQMNRIQPSKYSGTRYTDERELLGLNRWNEYVLLVDNPTADRLVDQNFPSISNSIVQYSNSIDIYNSKPKKKKQPASESGNVSEQEIEEIQKYYCTLYQKPTTSTRAWSKKLEGWRKSYSLDQIKSAINRLPSAFFWDNGAGNHLNILFNIRNKNGDCDYIGDLLSRPYKPRLDRNGEPVTLFDKFFLEVNDEAEAQRLTEEMEELQKEVQNANV